MDEVLRGLGANADTLTKAEKDALDQRGFVVLRDVLDARRVRIEQVAAEADPETLERLRAMGYVDD